MTHHRTVIAIIVLVSLGAWVIWPNDQFDPKSPAAASAKPSLTDINNRVVRVTAQLHAPNTRVGERLYMKHCAACHGKDLEGNSKWREHNSDGGRRAPPQADSEHTLHHDDQTLFLYTRQGGAALMAGLGITNFKAGMPSFQGVLSDQQIIDVLAYIKSQWGERSAPVQRERIEPKKGR